MSNKRDHARLVSAIIATRLGKLVEVHNDRVVAEQDRAIKEYRTARQSRGEKVLKRLGKNLPIKWGNDGLPHLALAEETIKEIVGTPPELKKQRVVFYAVLNHYEQPLQAEVYGNAVQFVKLAKEMEDLILKGDTSGIGGLLDNFYVN